MDVHIFLRELCVAGNETKERNFEKKTDVLIVYGVERKRQQPIKYTSSVP